MIFMIFYAIPHHYTFNVLYETAVISVLFFCCENVIIHNSLLVK